MVDGQPVFNAAAALARLGGDERLFRDLIGFFREDAPGLLAQFAKPKVRQTPPGRRISAHSLKGLVSNFDAHAATFAALRLEELGMSGDLTGANTLIDALANHVAQLEQQLGDYLART